MSDFLRFTVLGCGSSPGVPRIGGDWGVCDPRTRRTAGGAARCSRSAFRATALHQRPCRHQPGPSRAGALRRDRRDRRRALHAFPRRPHPRHRRPSRLRHEHAAPRRRLRRRGDACSGSRKRFGYCFETPPGSEYPPIAQRASDPRRRARDDQREGGRPHRAPDRPGARAHHVARLPHRRARSIRPT